MMSLIGKRDSMEDELARRIAEQSLATAKAMSAPANQEAELQIAGLIVHHHIKNVLKASDELEVLRRIAPQADQTAADLSFLQARIDLLVRTLKIDVRKCVMQHNVIV